VRITHVVLVLWAAIVMPACASLEGLRAFVQPPQFRQTDRPAEVRLAGPSADRPLGGATIRLWTEVSNPNPFGFTLGTLDGTLFLEGTRAAAAAFPLGLPLDPGQNSIVPIELSISFSDMGGLSDVIRRAARRESVEYRLEGTIGVDAGRLGQPVFGPMTLVRGDFRGDIPNR
jgi:late embryogenesis abundant protein